MRWGKPTKNKKRRDPRYFLNEGTELNEGLLPFKVSTVEYILNQIELAIGEVIRSDDTNYTQSFGSRRRGDLSGCPYLRRYA